MISKKDQLLLIEALRRKYKFYYHSHSINDWVGLGTAVQYKSKFFKKADGGKLTPRIKYWWVLTDLGVKALKAMESHYMLHGNYNWPVIEYEINKIKSLSLK